MPNETLGQIGVTTNQAGVEYEKREALVKFVLISLLPKDLEYTDFIDGMDLQDVNTASSMWSYICGKYG